MLSKYMGDLFCDLFEPVMVLRWKMYNGKWKVKSLPMNY